MYILAPNQTVEKFPYSIGELRRDHPNTSFPKRLSEELLASFGVFPVEPVEPELDPATQSARRLTPVFTDGKWIDTWEVFTADEEEIAQRKEAKAAEVRSKRDALLPSSDWTQVPDAYNAGIDIAAWAAYRQALRDIPEQPGFPWDIEWPSEPEPLEQPIILDYRAFYDALLISPAYAVIRSKAIENTAVLAACVEFIAAIGDAKSGRPNSAAIQACIDLLCDAAQFSPEELQALGEALSVGGLDQQYIIPS